MTSVRVDTHGPEDQGVLGGKGDLSGSSRSTAEVQPRLAESTGQDDASGLARIVASGEERGGNDVPPSSRTTDEVQARLGGPRPRVIAVNRFYAPDHAATAQLLTDLCEHLALPGGGRIGPGGGSIGGVAEPSATSVTVITSRLRYDDPKAPLPARETLNGVHVRRVWTTRFGRAGLWGRTLDYASFYLSATLALLIEAKRGDTILAKTDPPLFSIPAALVARYKGARLVNWCQDLFPETAAALGLRWAAGPLGRLLRASRNWSLKSAQCNVVLCEEMRQHLVAEGIPQESHGKQRIHVIHNWPDPAICPHATPQVDRSDAT